MTEEWGLVAVKRRWVPELLFAMFVWVIPYQPFRWAPRRCAPEGGLGGDRKSTFG